MNSILTFLVIFTCCVVIAISITVIIYDGEKTTPSDSFCWSACSELFNGTTDVSGLSYNRCACFFSECKLVRSYIRNYSVCIPSKDETVIIEVRK
jgi:hypothetical protein